MRKPFVSYDATHSKIFPTTFIIKERRRKKQFNLSPFSIVKDQTTLLNKDFK